MMNQIVLPMEENQSSLECQGANFISSSIPGVAIKVQNRKNPVHPMASAIKPVTEEASTLGIPIKLVSKAYWVAVNFLLVMLAMKAA